MTDYREEVKALIEEYNDVGDIDLFIGEMNKIKMHDTYPLQGKVACMGGVLNINYRYIDNNTIEYIYKDSTYTMHYKSLLSE